MGIIFMNSENDRTSEYHVLVLRLTDKLDLRRGQKSVDLSNLSIYYTWKNIKSPYNKIDLKYFLQHGMVSLNYRMDHIQYWIFRIVLSKFLKNIMRILINHQSEYM